ncbi:MAG: LysR family transcriptional regulator [Rubrivivax sp.]|nr:LysR family transcriptional regulator [Rubrivivax sp.]
MRHATLRQLKVFEAVARLLSYSRAAEELHLTQPAVSTQIRKLEEHAGNVLFEQFGKKIYLTAAGTELLQIARTIIEQFEAADSAMKQFNGVSGGRLNVGVISAGDYFFPRLLVDFAGRHENVALNFSVHNRQGLLNHIVENRIDLAVMVRPPTDLDTVNVPFAPHPYILVAAPGHELAGEASVPRERLLREGFVVRERGSDTWKAMEEGFGADITNLRVAMEIASTETIKQAVMAGMGISFLSLHTVGLEVRTGLLAIAEVEGTPVMRGWHVVHLTSKVLSPAAEAFRYFLIERGEALLVEHDTALLQPPVPGRPPAAPARAPLKARAPARPRAAATTGSRR